MASDAIPLKRSFRMDNRLMLLKDYLLDDLSSCSSSGFKSFPRRRHCCTNVRLFLVDNSRAAPALTNTRPSVHKTAALSAFQKASEAVLNAVKLLSVHNRSSVKISGFLVRIFSRKVFKRTFWKKKIVDDGRQIKDGEIHQWKTFHNLISEFPETPTPIDVTTTTTTANSSSIDDENSKSSGWLEDSSEYLESSKGDDDDEEDSVKKPAVDRSSGEAGGDPVDAESTTCFAAPVDKHKDRMMAKDEREQFSPVSVLDSPFHAEECDHYDIRLVQVKGARKLGRFETVSVDLDKRIAPMLSNSEDCSEPNDTINLNIEQARNMLHLVKSRIIMPRTSETNTLTFFVDNLLLDFFMDSVQDRSEHKLTEAAESYLTGKEKKMMTFDWKVDETRNFYIQDMKKGRAWKHVDDQMTELCMELEEMIWNSLVNDLVRER